MADFLLDSDVVIWHLRGRAEVVELVLTLVRRGRVGLSAITRAEVLLGMRDLHGLPGSVEQPFQSSIEASAMRLRSLLCDLE
jgi:predicted nucleic acid-binding protein